MKKIIVCGEYNAGKTTFVKNVNPRNFVGNEVNEVDPETITEKNSTTTISVEVNSVIFKGTEFLFFGVPGQERFEFIWEIVGENFEGIVFLHPSYKSAESLFKFLNFFSKFPSFEDAVKRVFITFPDRLKDLELLNSIGQTGITFEILDPRDEDKVRRAAKGLMEEILSKSE